MAKARRITEKITVVSTATDYVSSTLDISSFNCLCVQVSGSAGSGTLTIEISNDGVSWGSLGTATITSGKAIYNSGSTLVGSQLIRCKINMSSGTGDFQTTFSMKDLG